MNSISYFSNNLLKIRIKNKISSLSDKVVEAIVSSISNPSSTKYINFINNIQVSTKQLIKDIIVETFSELDQYYTNSSFRKERYNISKSNVSRTIITVVGDITFTRNYFISKLNNSCHFYIDELFGIPKYDHYD